MIRFVKPENIDRTAWDRCISGSVADLVYAYSWYLDLVSPGWCGIVEDDYSSVMPLPVKKKFGFNYIIQPPYTQQLGIFSVEEPDLKRISAFLNAIPSGYRFIDLNLNFSNSTEGMPYLFKSNTNYTLRLSGTADQIGDGFSENTRRNIRKAGEEVVIKENLVTAEHMEMVKGKSKLLRDHDRLKWLNIFMEKLISYGYGHLIGAYCRNELCASLFYILHKDRIYYLIPVSNAPGRERKAMFAIIGHLIKKYSGSSYILDFEGSNIEGIARFFKGFGAQPHAYPRVRINRLPFPVSLVRKKGEGSSAER